MSSRGRSSYDSRRESDRRRRDSLEAPETRRPKSNMPLMVALIVVVVLIVVGVIAIGYHMMNGDNDKKEANGNQVASGQPAANSAGREGAQTPPGSEPTPALREQAAAAERRAREAEAKQKAAEGKVEPVEARAVAAEAQVKELGQEKQALLEKQEKANRYSYKTLKKNHPQKVKWAKVVVLVGLLVIAGFWLLNMHNAGWDFDNSNAKSGDHVWSGDGGQGFGKVQQYAGADGLMNTADDEFVLLDNNGGAMTYNATANNSTGGGYMVGSSYGDDTSGVLFENYYKRIGAE